MSNPHPQVGDFVDVTIKGVRVVDVIDAHPGGYGRGIVIAVPSINGHGPGHFPIRHESPNVTVTVVEPAAPADWPPRAGDLWRDRDGQAWFAIDVTGSNDPTGSVIELVGLWGEHREPADVHQTSGPLTLVHREQVEETTVSGWPPKAGEVWKDRDGDEWTVSAEPGRVSMHDEGGNSMSAEDVRREWGPLTFVRRQQDEAKR